MCTVLWVPLRQAKPKKNACNVQIKKKTTYVYKDTILDIHEVRC